MMKKIIIVLLSIVLAFSMSVMVFAEELETIVVDKEFAAFERTVPDEIKKAMKNQYEAVVAYNLLVNNFAKDDVGLPIYPDEYGGAYIENGKLVLQLTDDSSENRSRYSSMCENKSKVVFK